VLGTIKLKSLLTGDYHCQIYYLALHKERNEQRHMSFRGVTINRVTIYHNTKMQQYVSWIVTILWTVHPK